GGQEEGQGREDRQEDFHALLARGRPFERFCRRSSRGCRLQLRATLCPAADHWRETLAVDIGGWHAKPPQRPLPVARRSRAMPRVTPVASKADVSPEYQAV